MPVRLSVRRSRPLFFGLAAGTICLGLAAPPLAAPKPKLSMPAARHIALGKEAGKVKSSELEHENGRWVYSFDIATSGQIHEVNVDANTGEVVEDSVETPADEAREKAADKKPS